MNRLLPLLAFLLAGHTGADEYTHKYKAGDKVDLWVNKVGPYANPQEAYEYYILPYCAPDTRHHPDNEGGAFNALKAHSIGEALGGHALRHSGHDLVYPNDSTIGETGVLETCTTKPLDAKQVALFAQAAQDQWFYQMYVDDLPVWGMVGEMLPDLDAAKELKPYVYTKRTLKVSYNEDRIIKVDLTSDPASLTEVKLGTSLKFELDIQWTKTNTPFHFRFDRYLDHAFFKHQIHWFSIFNSFMMVLFLMGLVALILLRTLRKDYARYALRRPNVGGPMTGVEDSGWKQVHGDVFRAPKFLPLLAAILGTGWQLVTLGLGVVLFAVAGPLHGEVHEERGEVLHAILVFYSLSSIVAGYASGSYFNGGGATQWQLTMALTVLLLPTILAGVLSILNGIALMYGTIYYIPFLAMLKLFFLWVFVSVPLCILGTLLGRHAKLGGKKSDPFPCRVNAIPRPIPDDIPWYGVPANLIPFAGLLSFGSIFIELYYILTSLWNYKFYHVYGFLLGVYAILILVVCMTTIIVVYFCLNSENYLWQWTAFYSGGSTALYVFLYSIYYFAFKTSMNGLVQTAFYFGYMLLISLGLGTLCGTLGHWSASKFVRTIFQNVKVD
ncbi:endomembrane protein EMP70 precusor [Thalassiosira pseudonana CCMP1335]|uniref:Transmembrane 9 superfamily member n=1 Tax=Thalassiosira pseudonana TaxID=35128 RepID=B8C415_THAPS|nr:endomembrane protein EMP70 precusor [Thalassiosira pseudonana CCMP1335]EED92654.1 endomembrane protein EMP70 precusor [Thalassiosira pseudonana CCMP1335]